MCIMDQYSVQLPSKDNSHFIPFSFFLTAMEKNRHIKTSFFFFLLYTVLPQSFLTVERRVIIIVRVGIL